MNTESLFSIALGLDTPWEVKGVEFTSTEQNHQELHLKIGFSKGAKFDDDTGQACSVHDTVPRKWQHLNFFQHTCFLHCDVPRIRTTDGKVKTVAVPWARVGSGFTLMFEALALALIKREMPVNRVAEMMGVNPQRIWNVFNHWIGKAREADDPSSITQLGIDETSTRKGHHYITLGVDMEAGRVIHVSEGKGKRAVGEIRDHLESKGVQAEQIEQASMDLSPAFIAGVTESFPKAAITFDRFHVVKLLNEAMDTVRKAERKEHAMLKGHKYTFLKNPDQLSASKREQLDEMLSLYPNLGNAYRLKHLFNDFWDMPTKEAAHQFLVEWAAEVRHYQIQAFEPFIKTLIGHWYGILHFIESRLTNGLLEGINQKVQLAKRRARGYRNISNFINMIYFLCGKINFDYPRYFT
jgi:transposase